MSWQDIIKAKISSEATKEYYEQIKELEKNIELIRSGLFLTPETEDNRYDKEALSELVNGILRTLVKVEVDLETLQSFSDDFEIAEVSSGTSRYNFMEKKRVI